MRLMKISLYRVAEVAIGCCLAIALAMLLGLTNSISAGVITILSILDTKKETLRSAVARLASFVLATAISFVAFSVLGYGIPAFGVYLFLFALASYALGLQASLPICTVLVSHYWLAGEMPWWLIGNEGLLMLIGTAIGVTLNLFVPRDVASIRRQQTYLENILRAFFLHLSNALTGDVVNPEQRAAVDADVEALRSALREARKQVRTLEGNTLLSDVTYYRDYITMRQSQLAVLRRMTDALGDLAYLPPQAEGLASFMWSIAQALHEGNDATLLLDQLDAMWARIRAGTLPASRDEFEARATLYRMLTDTEEFLQLKKTFVDSLSDAEKQTYLLSDNKKQA